MAGAAKWNCCRLGVSCVCIIQPCQQQWHFIWNHMPRVHACLAVTCHLHFWKRHKMVSRNQNFWRWREMRQGINAICSPVLTSNNQAKPVHGNINAEDWYVAQLRWAYDGYKQWGKTNDWWTSKTNLYDWILRDEPNIQYLHCKLCKACSLYSEYAC